MIINHCLSFYQAGVFPWPCYCCAGDGLCSGLMLSSHLPAAPATTPPRSLAGEYWVSHRNVRNAFKPTSTRNTIYLPDKLDPHIIHKSIMFILSQENTKMFFPHFEIQSDIHSNYTAFHMNHCLILWSLVLWLIHFLPYSIWNDHFTCGRIWGIIEVNPFIQ